MCGTACGYNRAVSESDILPNKIGRHFQVESVLGAGVLAGFPVVDLKVSLIDGRYHDVDSSALAFEIASRMAL